MAADFFFQQFAIQQEGAVHPMGTDSVLLGAWSPVDKARRILDIGTGTGIVALMLAQRNTAAQIVAVELDEITANCARKNILRSPWPDRIRVVQSSIQQYAYAAPSQHDLIVSNPPFFSETSLAHDVRRRQGRHQSFLRPGELIEAVLQLLTPDGKFCVVLPIREAALFQELAVFQRLYVTGERKVFSRPGKPMERILLQLERSPHHFERQLPLYIYQSEEMPSEDFRTLTGAFYKSF
ncbi:MAG: methyltransferase [Saprospiraceae bacterium]|nr:methyltransferase [Saprospiraceae bacterium]